MKWRGCYSPGSDPLTYSRMLRQIDETVKALNAHPRFPLPRIQNVIYPIRRKGCDGLIRHTPFGQPARLTIQEMAADYLAEIRTVHPIT